jgi:hypothetical protein
VRGVGLPAGASTELYPHATREAGRCEYTEGQRVEDPTKAEAELWKLAETHSLPKEPKPDPDAKATTKKGGDA